MAKKTTETTYPLVWDLDSLFPHPETDQFGSILSEYRDDLRQLAERSERLPPVDTEPETVSEWVRFLKELESVAGQGSDLGSFIGCHAAAEAENKLFQQLEGRLASLQPLRERISTNLEFALKPVSDDDLEAFCNADEWLQEIGFFLRDRRRNAELRLPKEQELLAAELGVDGLHAWGRLYDRLSGELRVKVMEKGELVEKSVGQVQFDSPQRAVRENSFFAADKAWTTIADSCADAINHIAGTRLTLYGRLGMDHLEVPCRLNRMKRETLDAMWSAVTERKSVLLDFLDRKAKAFGLKKPAWYDLTAPYPVSGRRPGEEELSYDEACRKIVETFTGFSPGFGSFARQALENRWVEAENRPGKRQGGFCTTLPTKKQSRIFMTFTNSVGAMSTLAHELGHAYHSWVLRDRPLFLRRYPMNLAETASTFAEAVLGEQQLRDSDSASEQLTMLDVMLSDAVSFLMNIHARFLFEDEFHGERAEGEVSASRLSELMLAAQKEAYKDGLAEQGWNPNFWISKLHFYITGYPFYNFPYTFGYLLSLGVYAVGAEGGDDFPDRYRALLVATGSMDTEEAVQSTMGYDLTRPDFWHKSLDIVEQRVKRFMELSGSP